MFRKHYIALCLSIILGASIPAALGGLSPSLALLGFGANHPTPQLITLKPGHFSYRLSGDFTKNNKPIDAPLRDIRFDTPLVVMKYLVSEADYQHCVEAKSCKPLIDKNKNRPNYPVTGISWEDATDYARWLSRQTGQSWRLPTDEEWAYMAGSKFKDDALGLGEEADIAERWIAKYEQEAQQSGSDTVMPQPLGSFGENEHGLSDLSANVWEWTNTCFKRYAFQQDGSNAKEPYEVCGIRIAAGKHRAYISDFIRDARGGGCAIGIPPSNLGLRLVRNNTPSLWQELQQSDNKQLQ